mmetsp:Transcript_39644/g.91606  ORF Transcript_39644/g.91606 Transcript_39644/m.91606 type:complete len:669 (+) Transcript_39644:46-2052(+)
MATLRMAEQSCSARNEGWSSFCSNQTNDSLDLLEPLDLLDDDLEVATDWPRNRYVEKARTAKTPKTLKQSFFANDEDETNNRVEFKSSLKRSFFDKAVCELDFHKPALANRVPSLRTGLGCRAGRSAEDEDEHSLINSEDLLVHSLPSDEPEAQTVEKEKSDRPPAPAEWPPANPQMPLRAVTEEPPVAQLEGLNATVGEAEEKHLFVKSAVAVLRHGERQDCKLGSPWHSTADAHLYPGDCPITDQAVHEARHVAETLRDFGEFSVIVASPYLRCVQTAIAIADELDLVVLLDNELGEVYGPAVFGDVEPREAFQSGHAWRTRHELHKAVKEWRPKVLRAFSKPPLQRVCWKRILGRAPDWGERMPTAQRRYACRFLTYLKRGRKAGKNMIVVSHGMMVQACLKILPSTSASHVASIPYCGGLMAHFRQIHRQSLCDELDPDTESFVQAQEEEEDADADGQQSEPLVLKAVDLQQRDAPSLTSVAEVVGSKCRYAPSISTVSKGADCEWRHCPSLLSSASKESTSERRDCSDRLAQARLHGWDVKLFGVAFVPGGFSQSSDGHRRRYQELLASLQAGRLSWLQLQLLLGDLPTELPPEAFQPNGVELNSDTASQMSMELFNTPCVRAISTMPEDTGLCLATREEQKVAPIPKLSLRNSRLMARRGSC